MKTILIVLLTCASALARIGETEPQIEARYGKPIKRISATDLPGPGHTQMYKSAGIQIMVTFIDGASGSECYSKSSHGKLELSEVETILTANAGEKRWLEVEIGHPLYDLRSRRWILGELPDVLIADFNRINSSLTLSSKKFLDAVGESDKAAAKNKLKGF